MYVVVLATYDMYYCVYNLQVQWHHYLGRYAQIDEEYPSWESLNLRYKDYEMLIGIEV